MVEEEAYNPVPEVKELPVNTQAPEVVVVVATEELKVWEVVPELKVKPEEVVLLPIVVSLALEPVPMFIAPVELVSIVKAPADETDSVAK